MSLTSISLVPLLLLFIILIALLYLPYVAQRGQIDSSEEVRDILRKNYTDLEYEAF